LNKNLNGGVPRSNRGRGHGGVPRPKSVSPFLARACPEPCRREGGKGDGRTMQQNTMSLYQAAREAGLSFPKEVEPQDRFVSVGPLRLHYLDWGTEGKPFMLLLHSNFQTCHTWDFFALTMCQEYHVLSLDLRGHGDSDWSPKSEYNHAAYLSDLEGLADTLKLPRFLLIGNAMGGMIFMAYAANHPEKARGLVMVDSAIEGQSEGGQEIRRFVTAPDELDSFEDFVERTYTFNPRRSKEQFRGSLRHSLKQLPNGKWTWKYDKIFRDPTIRRTPSHTSQQLWEFAARVQCPTLVFRGALSRVMSQETAAKLRDTLPHSRLIVQEGAGHMVMGDKPVEFERAVRAFIKDFSL